MNIDRFFYTLGLTLLLGIVTTGIVFVGTLCVVLGHAIFVQPKLPCEEFKDIPQRSIPARCITYFEAQKGEGDE